MRAEFCVISEELCKFQLENYAAVPRALEVLLGTITRDCELLGSHITNPSKVTCLKINIR